MSVIEELTSLNNEVTISERQSTVEPLKALLKPMCNKLLKLNASKKEIEGKLKEINKLIMAQETEIRKVWEPHILGSDKAVLEFSDFKVSTDKKLNVSVNDEEEGFGRDSAVEWLCNNGFKDCMKFDINTNTMKAIASSEFKEKDVRIPGLKYSWFYPIKIT